MYRQTSLRVACVACGVEQPLARMELAPHGGHWCWRCRVGAQIVEHEGAQRRADRQCRARPPSAWRQLAPTFAAVILILGGILLFGVWTLAHLALGRC